MVLNYDFCEVIACIFSLISYMKLGHKLFKYEIIGAWKCMDEIGFEVKFHKLGHHLAILKLKG